MWKYITKSGIICAILLSVAACGSEGKKEPYRGDIGALADCPVVAKREVIGKDTLTVVDINRADSTIVLKISDLADNLKFVPLDSRDAALVGKGVTWVSDNRIIIYSDGVVRQFDHSGNYLGRIGNKGHGKGEYTSPPCDIYIDEAAGRVYMAHPGSSKLISYYIEDGAFCEAIPFSYIFNKGRIYVDTENETISVASVPFKWSGKFANVWLQDFKGKIKSKVTKGWTAAVPDYSNEARISTMGSGDEFDYSVFYVRPRQDTLYSYHEGKLSPVFTSTMGTKGDKELLHEYVSTPYFFSVVLHENLHADRPEDQRIPALTPLVVDRRSLHGNFAHLMLDNVGPIIVNTNWLQESTGSHFVLTLDPNVLSEMLKAAAKKYEGVDEKIVARMTHLSDSIRPTDNNYVVMGTWKQ